MVKNEDYAKRAVELGHGILSTVEHGGISNVWECYNLAKKYNLKLVVGAEAYWVKDRFEKDTSNCHLVVIAKNENGRQALNDILSEANLTGFYSKPRLDVPLILSLPKDDVIVTTACVAGWKYEDVDDIWEAFADHFGKNFYFEVQAHNTKPQIELNQKILQMRDQLKVPIIMGYDSHYILPDHAQVRSNFLSSKGMEYPEEDGWQLDYADGDTMYERFAKQGVLSHSDIVDAIGNTNVLLDVEDYDSEIFNTDIKLPTIYPGWTQEQKDNEYERLVWNGWDAYKGGIPPERYPEYIQEIQNEINTVKECKMADYFIMNHHIIKKGQERGGKLTMTGRGSAVSFVTNMLLGFTQVDRLAASVKMYPDRFMSATRILQSGSLPDIDFNVSDPVPFAEAQQEVLGEDHAYPMVSFGTQKVSAAWKLYAKSQGVPFETANAVSEQIKKYELAVKHADEDDKDSVNIDKYIGPEYRDLFAQSADYMGVITSWSIAPCGFLLFDGSIRKQFGLVRVKDHICANIDGHWAEEAHFLKNDLLTVKVCDLIYKAYERCGMEPPSPLDLLKMCPPDDPAWKLYANGCTLCLNQVEKDGTSARVGVYKPVNISELCAFVAAIRPG